MAACALAARLSALGYETVAVFDPPDAKAPDVRLASRAIEVKFGELNDPEVLLQAAREADADAIHPGCGPLAGSPELARLCASAGIQFLGATVPQLELLQSSGDVEHIATGMRIPVFTSVATPPRNTQTIDVLVIGDGHGNAIAVADFSSPVTRGARGAFLETPLAEIPLGKRLAMRFHAGRLARAICLRSAATVRFQYDPEKERFWLDGMQAEFSPAWFLAERLSGADLISMLVTNRYELHQDLAAPVSADGCMVRLLAADPGKDFAPTSGRITSFEIPGDAVIATAVESGSDLPARDPSQPDELAWVATVGGRKSPARRAMQDVLATVQIHGLETNLEDLRRITASQPGIRPPASQSSPAIDVLAPGMQTTVQDYPGRIGRWDVGVPPSGPMDAYSFRLANRIVGNPESAAALEITLSGPTLKFRTAAIIAVCGADMQPELDGNPLPYAEPVEVPAGATLRFASASGPGMRAYFAVRGGIEAPVYLGSKSTFFLGKFGGPFGRALAKGDVLRIAPVDLESAPQSAAPATVPELGNEWEIGVLYGPHGAPDYFTDNDIEIFFDTAWTVHHNSDRTGVRLIGPKPEWARKDGGEAGLHPSNIHDNAYAIGTVDFTGDMPVILGPDGPSCGGFVCPATIMHPELWKLGQLRPGDRVSFIPLTLEAAERYTSQLEESLRSLTAPLPTLPPPTRESAVLMEQKQPAPALVCRADGDRNLLIEYGPNVLDLKLRFRAHALLQAIRESHLPGILDLTPGIRSLQVHYDSAKLSRDTLLETIAAANHEIEDLEDTTIPSRIVHLPISWDDPSTRLAIQRYTQSVNPDAPWCPSNIEFIRRINGLDSIDEVYRIFFDASYLVMGLGDVYLGAPVATPVDPRHRLVTTKYNPARTWTPENAVGIGGAYLCVYGMEGPGGYQFVGRTIQMWNTWRQTRDFAPGSPWLLRFFDQLRFYPVSAAELTEFREAFPHGDFQLNIEETEFSMSAYQDFLAGISEETEAFQNKRKKAFNEERSRWQRGEAPPPPPDPTTSHKHANGSVPVCATATASVARMLIQSGQTVKAGDSLLVLASASADVIVMAPSDGVIDEISCAPGDAVNAGQNLMKLRSL